MSASSPVTRGAEAASPLALATLNFLAWVAERPRSYEEAMDAWRTTCPRLTVWEDAVDAGLVRIDSAGAAGMGRARLCLTEAGRARLSRAAASPPAPPS